MSFLQDATAREGLAAMAMQGLCANPTTEKWSAAVMAGYCFVLADAMLKQAALSEQADD